MEESAQPTTYLPDTVLNKEQGGSIIFHVIYALNA